MTDLQAQQHKHAFTLNARCPATAITTPTLVRAAWALVAGCMTNSEDVTFGVTMSNHNLATGTAMLPARFKLSRHRTVSEYLCSVQNQVAEMGQHCPPCLQQISGINQGAAHACMFQTLLGVETGEDAALRKNSGLGSGQSQLGNQHPGLAILVQISGSSITATACYNAAMIEPKDLEALLFRLEHVMRQLDQASPAQELARISIISPHDLGRIWEWNREVPPTIKRCLHDMIEERIQSQPDYAAICAWDGDFTYGELGSLATALAVQLISKYGLGSGSVIPICFEKSKWTLVAILAVLKTGNGFILLDSNLPKQRLEAITRQVSPALIVSSPANESLCLQLCSTVVPLSAGNTPVGIAELECAFPTVSPDSIVWMVFTSGSTGTPKGVLISHQNVASALFHQQPGFGIEKSSRVYDFSSYGFDMSHCFVFQALVCGACVCVPNDADRRNDLAASMNGLRANTVFLTPSVSRLISPEQVPMIKSMVIGGEAIRISDVQTWFGKTRLINAYGPSECTPVSVLNVSSSPEDALLIALARIHGSWTLQMTVSCSHQALSANSSLRDLLWVLGI
jgi:non-ribosomal peptide synthetase component F